MKLKRFNFGTVQLIACAPSKTFDPEDTMVHDAFAITVRNILLLLLIIMTIAPGRVMPARQELLKLWKTLRPPLFSKNTKPAGNCRGTFWEIDMTKFEP